MKKILAILAIIVLTGCSTMNVTDYKDGEPKLVLEKYFNGQSRAYGVFQDRFGKVRREFTVDLTGEWNEKAQTLTLTEDFLYKDGETEQRIWTINKTAHDKYEGTADGTVGIAKGQISGNAFNWKYAFDLPMNGKKLRVQFDDWMWQQNERILFNKATIRKYGIRLGDVYITFEKL